MALSYPSMMLGDMLVKSEEWITILPDSRYREVTIRMWGKGVVLRGEVSGLEIASSKRLVVRKNQLIMSRIDARNGAIGIVPDFMDGAVVSNDFPTFRVNHEIVLPAYLNWLTKTDLFIDLCSASSEGTTNRVRLQEDKFLRLSVRLPPVCEQQRIVARIEELAGRIEEAKRLIEESREEMERLTVSMHLSLSADRQVRLGEIIELYEEQTAIEVGQSYPQVGVKGFGQGLFPKEAVMAGETTYRYFNRLYPGAIVLSQVKGWEGAIAVCPEALEGWYSSPEYRTFRCLPNRANPEYL